jgi:hypothetical protein
VRVVASHLRSAARSWFAAACYLVLWTACNPTTAHAHKHLFVSSRIPEIFVALELIDSDTSGASPRTNGLLALCKQNAGNDARIGSVEIS